MRTGMNTKLACALICCGSLAGCDTETIDAQVMYLHDSTASVSPESPWSTWLSILFAADTSLAAKSKYRLRMNGHWVMFEPDQMDYVTLSPRSGFVRQADNLTSGSYTVELVDASGKTALATSPLSFVAGRHNQIIVYGDRTHLDYYFFANSPAETDAVPDGSVLVRVINTRLDRKPLAVETCGTDTSFLATNCTPVQEPLSYGQMWKGVLPFGTIVALPCTVSEELCPMPPGGVGGRCPLPPSYTTMVPPKTQTLAVLGIDPSQPNAGFGLSDNNEYGAPNTCQPNP